MHINWPVFWSAFAGKMGAIVLVAICAVLGFGPEKWVEFVIAELPHWFTPGLARVALLGLAVYVLFTITRNAFQMAKEQPRPVRRKAKGTAMPRFSLGRLLLGIVVVGVLVIVWAANRSGEPTTYVVFELPVLTTPTPFSDKTTNISVGWHIRNNGNELARNIRWAAEILWIAHPGSNKTYIENKNAIDRNFSELVSKIAKELPEDNNVDLLPRRGMKEKIGMNISKNDFEAFKEGSRRLHVVSRVQWKDKSGTHAVEQCLFLSNDERYEWRGCKSHNRVYREAK